jgi:CHAD domain-containing protein
VAAFDTRLQLGRAEVLGSGVKRVTMEQLEVAASGFFEGESEFPRAVHESRKAIKRVRSLLRLVRGELNDRVFHYEDKLLRDMGRAISEIRSAAAMTGAVNLVSDLYGDLLADDTFDEMTSRFEHRRDVLELNALEDPVLVERIVRDLEKAYHRYSGWPTDTESREVYGVGIREGFEAIGPGLSATYGRGRKEMVTAYTRPLPEHFHSWRKRAKYLRHQMEFLVPLWPEVVAGMAVTLYRLGEILGEDHDLAEVIELIHERPDLCPDPRERSLFTALAQQRRSELHVAAEILGRRVYAEKPGALRARFSEYWDARHLAISQALDTLVVY